MVNLASYDNEVTEEQPASGSWTNTVRDAVKEFVASVGDSTKQLTAAAERFASETFVQIDEATQRAEKASKDSASAAQTAAEAASEARRASDMITEAVTTVGEKVREEARTIIQDAVTKAEQVVEAGERLKVELQDRIAQAVERTERSATATQQAASAGREAAKVAEESATTAQQHFGEVRETAERVRRSVETIYEAMNAAQQAASEARQAAAQSSQHAWRAEQAVSEATLGGNAKEILERLETDYQMLTRLVTELHGKVAVPADDTKVSWETLAPTFETKLPDLEPVTPPADVAPSIETPVAETPAETAQPEAVAEAAADAVQVNPDAPVVETPVAETAVETPSEPSIEEKVEALWSGANVATDTPAEAPVEAPEATAAPQAAPAASSPDLNPSALASVAGKVLVSISPVPDFDRLLNLDGALGRMQAVRNVSLADYAKEEVTFRIEVESAMTAGEFASRLGESAAIQVEAVSAGEGNLSLRIR